MLYWIFQHGNVVLIGAVAEVEDDDTMEEINTDNIISDGRRTRGKNIDFKKAAQELEDDDEEDEDDDFQDPDAQDQDDAMQE